MTKTRKIYSYTTRLDRAAGQRKIGQTDQEEAQDRVNQQDSTSNSGPLELEHVWEVPDHIRDADVHRRLEKLGFLRTRTDKDREWFIVELQDVHSVINDLMYGVARPNSHPMRDEQRACVEKISRLWRSGVSKKALMAAKMRYGKTFTAYQLMREMGFTRVLVLTYKPAVQDGWREDLMDHVDFDGWSFLSASEFSAKQPIDFTGDGPLVLFASFQDFNDFDKPKWQNAKSWHWDMLIIDEMHFGAGTDRAMHSVAQLSYDHVLNCSGTPLHALMSGEFLDEEIYGWNYIDEQQKRSAEMAGGWATEVYRWLPVMHIHQFQVCDEAKAAASNLYSEDEQFTLTKLLGSDDGITLNEAASVKIFMDQIFGRNVRKEHSPIKTHAADHIFMVVPPSVKSVDALALLLDQMVGQEYKIINVAGDNVTDLSEVKDAIARNPKTITVSCGRFNTGVTVPEWDMVLMLNDSRSPTTYFQTIFRVQSPDKRRRKEACYVVDFNPQRCLEMVYEYATVVSKAGQSTQDTLRQFLECAPITDHTGNALVSVTTDHVLNLMSQLGDYASKFKSSHLFNWEKLDDMAIILRGLDKEASSKVKEQVADSDVDIGKNYLPGSKARQTGDDMTTLEKKAAADLRERAITMMSRLPTYLFITDSKIDDISQLIAHGDDDTMRGCLGVDRQQLAMLCQGFVNIDRVNRCIMAFNQIERFMEAQL